MSYTGKEIDRAGQILRLGSEKNSHEDFSHALDVMSFWRSSHVDALDLAFNKLQVIALKEDKDTIFAKRLKRAPSIEKKLWRYDGMTLRNMQDIGGCRAVFSTEKRLRKALRAVKALPEFKWEDGRYRLKDYINEPQESGYRSVHIIGRFKNAQGELRRIEIQLRTRIQHDWATSLEIVDLFTGQALKSNAGDDQWHTFFRNISEQFCVMDSIANYYHLTANKKFQVFKATVIYRRNKHLQACRTTNEFAKKLKVVDKLVAFSNSLKIIDGKLSNQSFDGFILLRIDIPQTTLHSKIFESNKFDDAELEYVSLEKKYTDDSGSVVALVSAASVGGIKEAYPNFFGDSSNFLEHLRIIMAI